MGTARGTLYVAAKSYVEKTFGADAVQPCLDTMAKGDEQLLTSVLPVGWYPIEPMLGFLRAVDTVHGTGDLAQCTAVGRHSADWALPMFHKLFLRFKTPHWLIERSQRVWSTYYDTGRWEPLPGSETSIAARLHEFDAVDDAACFRLKGWLCRAAELTGAKAAHAEHPRCRAHGHDYCQFELNWKPG